MATLIDAEKLKLLIRDDPNIRGSQYALMKKHIKEATVVDAVEVVRCKECHWWRKINAKNGCGICRHEVFSVDDCTVDPVTEPDDFCSYGERKDNG